jgi:Ni/Co efflux regulator RcnB
MAPLNQPWQDYLAQKAAMKEASAQALAAEDSEVEKDSDDDAEKDSDDEAAKDSEDEKDSDCEEMGDQTPHPLGSTVSCGYRSHMACEVVMQGSTETSG